jgi:kinesin family protein 5
LLQGGNARTVMIVCCSPCADNGAETLSSLRFGSRARGIQSRPLVNSRIDPKRLQAQLAAARAQVGCLGLWESSWQVR